MAVTIKKVTLWRTEVENKPGALSGVLAPLAEVWRRFAGGDGLSISGRQAQGHDRGCPVSGKKSAAAASKAGLAASAIPTLLVQGDNRPGLGHAIAQAIAEARINVAFLVAQVIDTQFSAVIGFASEAASKRAAALIKNAVKEIEKQFPSSASGAETTGGSPLRRNRAPILCRKKCDVLLGSICSENLPAH